MKSTDVEVARKISWLVVSAFITAFGIALGVPYLLSKITQLSSEPVKTTVTLLSAPVSALLVGLFTNASIEKMVSDAISQGAAKRTAEYKEEFKDIENVRRNQLKEYLCYIPERSVSQKAEVEVGSRPILFCNRRAARDAIIKGLAYNKDKVLLKIAVYGADFALKDLKGSKDLLQKESRDDFYNDVYAYLKAWLMFSIAHDHPMPVGYIKQRYSDKRAYIRALEQIKTTIRIIAVDEYLEKPHQDEAEKVLQEFLEILIHELKA